MKIPGFVVAAITSAICVMSITQCTQKKQIEPVSDTVSRIPDNTFSEEQRVELIKFYSDRAAKFDRLSRNAQSVESKDKYNKQLIECKIKLYQLTK